MSLQNPASRSREGKLWEAVECMAGTLQPTQLDLTRKEQEVRGTSVE